MVIYIDGEEVMEMIKNLGYSPQFDIKEKFYNVVIPLAQPEKSPV